MEFKKIRTAAFANDVLKGAKILTTKNSIELHLAKEVSLNTLVLKEKISLGQRVVSFEVTGGNNLEFFNPICKGTTIGHKRILQFPTQKLKYIRIKFTETKAPPIIAGVAGYLVK
jgi:alpha-L-fucosidase